MDSECVVFTTTASVSQNTNVEFAIGMPNIRSLYLSASIRSIAVFKAIYSDPNVEDLTVFWRLEYHTIGATLT